GIISGVSKTVDAVKGALGTVRSYLPFSDAKVGPLSDLTASGAALMTTFEKGMGSVDLSGKMEHILPQPIAAPAASTGQAGGSVSNSSSISIGDVHLSQDYNFEELMKDINLHQAQNRTQRGA
ncbi:MAG: hypothetical protein U9R21_08835, partial [Candidatus Thermoplasmatota archaeon]|nr:hypothetical protein [Candidatus Thermoplasmatota archaeon]